MPGTFSSDPNSEQEQIVLFEIDQQLYGLPFSCVREVLRAFSFSPLPNAPPIVEGLLNVRGELMPLLNLRKRLGFPEKPLSLTDHFLIARDQNRWVALRVDRVVKLAAWPTLKAADAGRFVSQSELISAVAATQEGLLLIQDLTKFLTPTERQKVFAAVPSAPKNPGKKDDIHGTGQ